MSELTDDTLLDLLAQACDELATRAPEVRRLAQQTVIDGAAKIEIQKQAIETELQKAKEDYLYTLRSEVREDIAKAVNAGEIRVLSPEEEANQVKLVTEEFKERMLQEARQRVNAKAFYFELRGNILTLPFGPQRVSVRVPGTPESIEKIIQTFQSLF